MEENINLLCLRFCVGFKAGICRNLSKTPWNFWVFCAALDLTQNLALTTILLTSRSVRVDPESVNSAAIDVDPQNKFVRMMVSAFLSLSPDGRTIIARDTTIMPQIPGMQAIMCLLFTPMAELRLVALCFWRTPLVLCCQALSRLSVCVHHWLLGKGMDLQVAF